MSGDDRTFWLWVVAVTLVSLMALGIVSLNGCSHYYDPLRTFDEIPDLGLSTIPSVMDWVSDEIWYVSDDIHYPANEYWQSPLQTYVWRTGDCEDYCILALYLIHRDVGIDGKMALGGYNGYGHAWVYVDGHYWEPQLGSIIDGHPLYSLAYTIGYDEVIERATTTHRALTSGNE